MVDAITVETTGGKLRGERCTLARSFEANRPGARPRERGTLRIGDRDDRVVKRRKNVRDAGMDVEGYLFAT